jgi:hypothetical protein
MPCTGGGYNSRQMSSTCGVMSATSILFVILAMAAPGLSAYAASCAHLRVPGVVVLMFLAFPRESGAWDSRAMYSV